MTLHTGGFAGFRAEVTPMACPVAWAGHAMQKLCICPATTQGSIGLGRLPNTAFLNMDTAVAVHHEPVTTDVGIGVLGTPEPWRGTEKNMQMHIMPRLCELWIDAFCFILHVHDGWGPKIRYA
jgi:hypothetical protein